MLFSYASLASAQDSLRLTINLEGFKKNDKLVLYFNDQGHRLGTEKSQLRHTSYLDGPQEAAVTFKNRIKSFWIENGDIELTISKATLFKQGVKVKGSKSELLNQDIKKANRAERAKLLEANIGHPIVKSYMRRHKPDLEADDIARIREKMPDEINEFAQYHLGMMDIKKSETLKVGDMMMDFVAMTAEDTQVDTKNLRGKYLLLDFAGTSCSWCWVTYPQMAKDLTGYENLNVLTFNEDYLVERWKKLAEKREIDLPWPVLWKAENKEDIFKSYGVNVLPTYLLVSPEGKILEYWRGGKEKKITKKLDKYGID